MIFSQSIYVQPNTTADQPLVTFLPVTMGVIRRVFIRWRWGSANLCGCRILYHSFQIMPITLGQWFRSSDRDIVFEEDYALETEPFELEIDSYNYDNVFQHELWVAFVIFPFNSLLGGDYTYACRTSTLA